ncbi:efflux RND transporter permease subunit [Paenibacillus eucommiae]|uniref:HAE1 family hydrophobic/amphiphilic exporter-1 n=1 Tax=Paenibacillus eucommiae TaxID=1355755 RepID=A0ABS4IMN2_9BACL|nr:efflux RND transporter permease subunit [Paenibacillus eucommiae]MBP1988768.1 HAE1 family hydrophobic/amphiphilic exporter-1 [Paenibacillus eucommiae]
MTWFTKWAFVNKAAVLFMAVLFMGLGIFSYFKLPMEYLPSADRPEVSITIIGQGFDAQTMLTGATEPLEHALSIVKGKKEMFSTSADGFAKIEMTFDSGMNMKDAKANVQEAVNAITLPQGMSKPFVVQFNTSMRPIAQLSLTFKDGLTKENIALAQDRILPKFQQINGVSSAVLSGASESRVWIHPDKDKLAQAKVPLQALTGALKGQNMSAAIGEKSIDGKASEIKVIGNLTDLAAVGNLIIAPGIKLKDVAAVEAASNQESIMRVNGKDSLEIIVTKDASSNAVTIGKEIATTAEGIQKQYPNATAEIYNATSDKVVSSVNSMMREVLLGALFAAIVILLFLRNLRSTLITVFSIPLSLGLTLFLLSKSGVTLNLLTLGGVAVAVGRLVDDSIVVIENIFRRTQKAEFSKELIIDSVREVAKAITASTLTTVAVFLPIGLLEGTLQAFLLPFALTVTYALLSSLFVALTVVPLMSAWLLRNASLKPHREPGRLLHVLAWALNHKIIAIGLSLFLFIGSIVMYIALPKGAVSAEDDTSLSFGLTYSPETPATTFKEKAIEFEKFIMSQSEVKYVIMQLGNSEENAKSGQVVSSRNAQYSVLLKEGVNADHFREQINSYDADSDTGPKVTPVTLDLTGDNKQELAKAAAVVTAAVKAIEGVEDVSSNQDETKPGYAIVVDPALANPQETALTIRSLLNPTPIGSMVLDGRDTPVFLDGMIHPSTSTDLAGLQIMTRTGTAALSSIAKIEKTNGSSSFYQKNGQPYIRITAQVITDKMSDMNTEISTVIKDLKLPSSIAVVQGGAFIDQTGDFTDLYMNMLVSIGIVFLIMLITFKTFRAPIACILSLPFAAIGAVLAMMVTGTPFEMTSIFGIVMLIGIVVTNAIVLIDRVNQNEQNMNIREALLEAASSRMRPILMTAVATICAMLPLLFAKSEQGSLVSKGLAVVVIGGLSFATVFTLIMVPTFYEALHYMKARRERKQQADANMVAA